MCKTISRIHVDVQNVSVNYENLERLILVKIKLNSIFLVDCITKILYFCNLTNSVVPQKAILKEYVFRNLKIGQVIVKKSETNHKKGVLEKSLNSFLMITYLSKHKVKKYDTR